MMEASSLGDMMVSGIPMPGPCKSCVYRRFVSPKIGHEDMPRLRGPIRNGHSQSPCTMCSANPRFSVMYSSAGGTRRLKGLMVRVAEGI